MKADYALLDTLAADEIQDGLTVFVSQAAFALDCARFAVREDDYFTIDEYTRKSGANEADDLYNISHMTRFDDLYGCFDLTARHVYTTREEQHAHLLAFIGAKSHF